MRYFMLSYAYPYGIKKYSVMLKTKTKYNIPISFHKKKIDKHKKISKKVPFHEVYYLCLILTQYRID